MKIMILCTASLSTLAFATVSPGHASGHDYTVVDLGAIADGKEAWAYDINAAGQVAMAAHAQSDSYSPRAALWETGSAAPTPVPGFAPISFAVGLNDAGILVGGTSTAAFVVEGETLSVLPELSPGGRDMAVDVNAAGAIVGFSFSGVSLGNVQAPHAVLWPAEGGMVDLGTLGGLFSEAHALNALGQVAGFAATEEGYKHAFVWDGTMVDLGTLGGRFSEAWDINAKGHVVGTAQNEKDELRAFCVRDGGMVDLGSLHEARSSEAFGVNALDQIVGTSWVRDVGPQAVLYDAGMVINLNDLIEEGTGWNLQVARAINDTGAIVGYGRLNGETRAFLVTPPACEGDSMRHRFLCNFVRAKRHFASGL